MERGMDWNVELNGTWNGLERGIEWSMELLRNATPRRVVLTQLYTIPSLMIKFQLWLQDHQGMYTQLKYNSIPSV